MSSLLADYAGKVKLIYIDPPFNTGAAQTRAASTPSRSPISSSREDRGCRRTSILASSMRGI